MKRKRLHTSGLLFLFASILTFISVFEFPIDCKIDKDISNLSTNCAFICIFLPEDKSTTVSPNLTDSYLLANHG